MPAAKELRISLQQHLPWLPQRQQVHAGAFTPMPACVDASQSTLKTATQEEGMSAQAFAGVELPQAYGICDNDMVQLEAYQWLSQCSGTPSSQSQDDVLVASNACQERLVTQAARQPALEPCLEPQMTVAAGGHAACSACSLCPCQM